MRPGINKDNPIHRLMNAPRCGAKTRKGTPCQGFAVRGKKRCRMHGGTNPGRPKDPAVQERKYYQMVRSFIYKKCRKCDSANPECQKVFVGKELPEDFEDRITRYCKS
jgi:hypothetical protein